MKTSCGWLGSRPARRIAAPIAIDPSRGAGNRASLPRNEPIGVRAVLTMTASIFDEEERRRMRQICDIAVARSNEKVSRFRLDFLRDLYIRLVYKKSCSDPTSLVYLVILGKFFMPSLLCGQMPAVTSVDR